MIATIAGDVGSDEAERIVRSTAPGGAVRVVRKLYYPYFWFQLRYTATSLFGRTAVRVSCMVDSRTRVSATTDPFAVELIDPDERDVVAPRVDAPEARRLAERYTAYLLRNKRRALVAPSVDVVACRLVYKPFWIVRSEPAVRVLVDGVTGGFCPLPGSVVKSS